LGLNFGDTTAVGLLVDRGWAERPRRLKGVQLESVDFGEKVFVLLFKEVELVLVELTDFWDRICEIVDLPTEMGELFDVGFDFSVALLKQFLRCVQFDLKVLELAEQEAFGEIVNVHELVSPGR
jgi:hypothetical protein